MTRYVKINGRPEVYDLSDGSLSEECVGILKGRKSQANVYSAEALLNAIEVYMPKDDAPLLIWRVPYPEDKDPQPTAEMIIAEENAKRHQAAALVAYRVNQRKEAKE